MLRHRHGVLGFLILLFAITHIDRVCISVAGPRIQEEPGLDTEPRTLRHMRFRGGWRYDLRRSSR